MHAPAEGRIQTFSDIELGFIAEMKTDHIVVSPRADIIRDDEVGGPVYTLFEGWAIRYHRLPNGTRQILDIMLPGDIVGLASAVLGRVKHSVQAITRRRSVFFRAEVFRSCSSVTRRWR